MRGITFPTSWVMGSWVCHLRDVLQLCAGLAWRNSRFDNCQLSPPPPPSFPSPGHARPYSLIGFRVDKILSA